MSKKVIVLADNSYTIRRIVELSFSEIEDVEVRSFESGAGIQDRLLQLAPAVVIVDVKLPEFSGYDVCRFINETPALKDCRVFLMKGSFEPVDSEMIRPLRYEDIITKPFDSNALVDTVMKVVRRGEPAAAAFPGEGPTTFPEDFPEIETEMPESEDISFSDIRGEMEVPAAHRPAAAPPPEREEILPSEEITQTQPAKDNLTPQEAEEPLKNPFDEEPAFEEINTTAPAAAPSAPLEFAVEPTAVSRDVSDEFHERFMEIASEDILTPSAGAGAGEEKLALEFEQTDMGSPAQTLYAGPEVQDRLAATRKAAPPAPPATAAAEKAPARERAGEKPRAEVLSPQDELARLSDLAKREPRPEPAPRPAAAEAQRLELTGKLEDRLNQTIKELLWEIVPPLAEKIIKEEIDKIKSELNESGF